MTTELSNTPETDNLARGNHVVPTDWAEQLERERDEARADLEHIKEYGTEEINAAVELRQKLASALIERDDARDMVEKLTQQGLTLMDESRSLKRDKK
jgi:hypothetical protein